MKSAVRQQHDGEWNKTVMQIVNEERRFTTWRVRMGALKSRLTEIRAAIAVGDDLSSGQQISRPPRFAQEKYTPDPASCAFEIHEWKLKMSQLGRLIPRLPRNNHSIEKNTELDHPASFDDVVRSPGKIANWSIEIGTRNEISIVLIIEKRKRNEIFRRIFPCFLIRNITCKNNFSSFFPRFSFLFFLITVSFRAATIPLLHFVTHASTHRYK